MISRKVHLIFVFLVLTVNGIFSLPNDIDMSFNLLIKKEGESKAWFYDSEEGAKDIEANTFMFSRSVEDATTPATEEIGIAWIVYDNEIDSISLEFTDNFTHEYMFRYLDGEPSNYNYSVSIENFNSIDAENRTEGVFTQPPNDIKAIPSAMTKAMRTLVFKREQSDSRPAYPLTGNAEMLLTLAPDDSTGFMAGQYSGQIIVTMEAQ